MKVRRLSGAELEEARRAGRAPSPAAPRVTGFADFTESDRMYQAACDVLKRPEGLARLVMEIAVSPGKPGPG